MEAHDSAALEFEPKMLDQAALIDERLRGHDAARDAVALRQRVDFFRRQVRDERHMRRRHLRTARPEMAFRQLDPEVCAELVCIMQAGKVIGIEELRRAVQVVDMVVPGGNDILLPADADRAEDCVPELCNGLVFRSLREDFLRPGSRRHRGDAPGILVRHEAGAVFEQRGSCRLLRERQPLRIDARKDFRVARSNRDESRALLGIIRIERTPPFGKLRKDGRPGHVVLDAG